MRVTGDRVVERPKQSEDKMKKRSVPFIVVLPTMLAMSCGVSSAPSDKPTPVNPATGAVVLELAPPKSPLTTMPSPPQEVIHMNPPNNTIDRFLLTPLVPEPAVNTTPPKPQPKIYKNPPAPNLKEKTAHPF